MSDTATDRGDSGDRRLAWQVFAGLAVVTLAVYGQSVGYGVLTYDSNHYITGNPLLETPTLASLAALWRPGSVESEALYIPLAYSSWWLEALVGGLSPALMHAVNLLLHVACVGGVFLLARRLSGSVTAAAVAGGIFAFHPLQVETVAWLMGRKDLLSTLFAIGAMLAWLRWTERRQALWAAAVVAACLASWLAKPSTLVLPPILLGLGWVARRTIGRADAVFAVILLALAGGVYGLNRLIHLDTLAPPPFRHRLGAVPELLLGWLGRLTAMKNPAPYYAWPDPHAPHVGLHLVFGLLMLALAGGVFWAWRRDWRLTVWGLAATAVAFVPVIQVTLSYRHFLTADHYGYFPLIGVAIACSQIALVRRRQWHVGLFILCLFLATSSNLHLPTYGSSEAFWLAATRSAPGSPHTWYGLGKTYELDGREVDAIRAYTQAVTVDPKHVDSLYNLANLLATGPDTDAAASYYHAAIAAKPNYVEAWVNLGNLELQRDNLAAAETAYRTATDYDSPFRSAAYMNLATTLKRQERDDEAAAVYREAIAAAPTFSPAYIELARLQGEAGDSAAAFATLRAAIAAGADLPPELRDRLQTMP